MIVTLFRFRHAKLNKYWYFFCITISSKRNIQVCKHNYPKLFNSKLFVGDL